MLDFLSYHTPNSKVVGSTSGVIILAVVMFFMLAVLIGPAFWASVRPDVRRPGQPRPARPRRTARSRHRGIRSNAGQGYAPADEPGDRYIRDGGNHHGKPASWIVVGVVTVAFIVGGLALIFQAWSLFWICVAIAVLGFPAGLAVGIMNDTVEFGSSEAALTSGSGSDEETGPDGETRPDGQPVHVPGGRQHRP